MPAKWLEDSQMSVRQLYRSLLGANQMAETILNGWDSDKPLGLRQMSGTQPNGWNSDKWLGLRQMAGAQPNGWSSAKWLGLSQMARTSSSYSVYKFNHGKEGLKNHRY